MKKVGIITYHHHYNYGTALQAYALQKAIDNIEGYQAELIDYRLVEEQKLSKLQMIWLRIRRMPTYFIEWKRVRALKKYGGELVKKHPAFDRFFRDDFVTGGKIYSDFKELSKDSPVYDIMVTGSDQTWSPMIGFHPAMFLEFGSPKALRISYAASLGVSKLNKEEANYLNIHLQPYEAISCREILGAKLLQSTVKGKTVTNVLDPTLLLTPEDWNKIAESPQIKGEYILCYFIGHKTYYREIAQQLSKDMGLPLFFIPVSWQDLGNGYTLVPDAGPKEFLGLIQDARLILTDSFHGTIFSINYRKSFYSFTKIEGGKSASDNSRLYDILSKLHLEDRLYDKPSEIKFSDVDYSEAEALLENERKHSLDYLHEALKDKRICVHTECTGCMACESACTHAAVKINKDLMGFMYPVKDQLLCVNCGLCEKVCPNHTLPQFSKAKEAYVATAVDNDERLSSTSGGLASLMARYVIRKGGVVYGCTSQDASHVRHIRIDKDDDVALLKGSKYVQSDMRGIMASVKEDLQKGLQVLFVGTPCLVAGLRTMLRKPYDNLIAVDFVCHGVPSQQLLTDIVGKEKGPINGKKIDFRFRDEDGKSHYGIKITDENGQCEHKETYPKSRYISGFLGGMYYRESCYQCHYAKGERVSDITLGDYWDKECQFNGVSHGKDCLSMMLLNTPQGAAFVESLKQNIRMQKVSVDALVARNSQLKVPMKRHKLYNVFLSEYSVSGYNENAAKVIDKEINRVEKAIAINKVAIRFKGIVTFLRLKK